MLEERFDEACPLIRSSHEAAPSRGTLFTLAECERLGGRLLEAARIYERFLVEAPPGDDSSRELARQRVAREQLDELSRRLPAVRVRVAGEVPASAEIWLDGQSVSLKQLDQAMLVEVGTHVVAFRSAGRPRREIIVDVSAGERRSIELRFRETESPAPPTPPSSGTAIVPWRVTAAVTGGAALAGIVVGSVSGAIALSEQSTADDLCDGPACREQRGVDAGRSAKNAATISTAGFVAGGALAAVAVAAIVIDLSITGDDDGGSGASVGLGPRGVALHTRF